MFAVFVDNHQLGVTELVNGTIYDCEDTARQIASHINQNSPAFISAWIHDFLPAGPIDKPETQVKMLAEEE